MQHTTKPLHALIVEHARDMYANHDIEIDSMPLVSEATDGAWVAAWVWVPQHRYLADDSTRADGPTDMRQWNSAQINEFYDAHPDVTLAQLSIATGKTVPELKSILMGAGHA